MKIGYVSLGGITTDDDGTVTYDFDGHVHAQGLDLTIPNPSDPDAHAHSTITWSDEDGTFVVSITGADDGLPRLLISAGGVDITLLNANGHSAFIQAAGPAPNLRLSAATIDDDGTLLDDEGGITASARLGAGTGTYRYTFDNPGARYLVPVPLVNSGAVAAEISDVTDTTVTAVFFDSTNGGNADVPHWILWIERL